MRNKDYSSPRDDGGFMKERNGLKRANRMQNTMLLTDLATNLAAIIARNRGARYTVATNLSAKTPPYVTQAKQRLRAVQNDYNGKIANFYLRGSAPYNDTHIAAAPKFISDVGTKQSDWENSNNKLFTKNR